MNFTSHFRLCLSLLLTCATVLAHDDETHRSENIVILDEAGVANLGIQTAEAKQSTFESTLFALGEIQAPVDSIAVLSSRVPGRITHAAVREGDMVRAGNVLAVLESRQPGSPPPSIELRAPGHGLIVNSRLQAGAPVDPEDRLAEILDLKALTVAARVPQNEAALLHARPAASIAIPALGIKSLPVKFERIAVAADASKGLIDAVFSLSEHDPQLRPGMRIEITIIRSQREEVLSIPRDALQGEPSNRFVFIKDGELENAFVRVPVISGAMNSQSVEILSGLHQGDEVVTRGSYSLAYAGAGSLSLKEAMDAAHGHAHNEDGSEITSNHDHSHDHPADPYDHKATTPGQWTLLAKGLTAVSVILLGLVVYSQIRIAQLS